MRNSWKNLWPECLNEDFTEDNLNDVSAEILNMADYIVFSDVEESDIIDFVNFRDEPLSNFELFELIEQDTVSTEKVTDVESCEENREMPLNKITEAFEDIDKAINIFEECDYDEERVESTRRLLGSLYAVKTLCIRGTLILLSNQFHQIFDQI